MKKSKLTEKPSRTPDLFEDQMTTIMPGNGATTIYTVNEQDFAIFEEIKAINPFKV